MRACRSLSLFYSGLMIQVLDKNKKDLSLNHWRRSMPKRKEINKVLVAMDMEIAMARRDAQHIVNIIENWEA